MRYNFAADSFYIMKLCSRLFVLHCRNCPKYDSNRHFDPHFEEVRGGVEPCSMARWKALAKFLLAVNLIEIPLSLTCLFMLLPHHLLTLSKLATLTIHNPLALSLPAQNLFLSQLCSRLMTDSTDFVAGPFLPSIAVVYGCPA